MHLRNVAALITNYCFNLRSLYSVAFRKSTGCIDKKRWMLGQDCTLCCYAQAFSFVGIRNWVSVSHVSENRKEILLMHLYGDHLLCNAEDPCVHGMSQIVMVLFFTNSFVVGLRSIDFSTLLR